MYPNLMHPYLFQNTPYQMITWNVMYWIGAVVSGALSLIWNPKDFVFPRMKRLYLLILLHLTGPFAERALSEIIHIHKYLTGEWVAWQRSLIYGGGASLGGLIAVVVVISLFSKYFLGGTNPLKILDFAIRFFFVALIFVRIGCFLNGCCYGAYTHLLWACKFGDNVPRHPTQLYSIIVSIIVIITSISIYRKKLPVGTTFFSTIGLYAFLRFFIELLRVDNASIGKINLALLTMATIFSICVSSLIYLLKIRRN